MHYEDLKWQIVMVQYKVHKKQLNKLKKILKLILLNLKLNLS